MLTALREAMHALDTEHEVHDLMMEGLDPVRDKFLDEPELVVLGAEEDPEIASLVNDIPEYGLGKDSSIEGEIASLSESLVETQI